MKIELVKIDGNVSGYNLIAENDCEKSALEILGGMHSNAGEKLRYNGTESDENGKTASKLNFIQDKFSLADLKSLARIGAVETEIVEKKNDVTYRCEECGSTDVEIKAWVKPNEGNEYSSDVSNSFEKYDCWCHNCEDHCTLDGRNEDEIYDEEEDE